MRAHGHIHGEPILWCTGPSNYDNGLNLIAVVWDGAKPYMHFRPIERRRAFQSNDLARAYLRREITRAELELRKRVTKGAQRG